jgi:hypothetical protein
MLGWKAKATIDEPPIESETEPEMEEDQPTWSDGTLGPNNPVSRIYGRLRGDADHEARLASAE